MNEREFTPLVGRSVDRSVDFLRSETFICISADQAQLDLRKRRMSNSSENVKHSEAMSDEIITAMSTACGASIFLFELLKKTRKQFVCLPV